MSRGAQLFALVVVGVLAAGPAWGQPTQRPTQQQVEAFLAGAVAPLRSCLQRSLPAPPRPAVVVTLEFDSSGGFPMPTAIEAAPGSVVERCVGEALAELSAPVVPGPPLVVQCRLPLVNAMAVQCRPATVAVPPAAAPPPPPPPPVASAGAPPAPPGPALSRDEVAGAMRALSPRVMQCAAAANPPPVLRLTVEIHGDGTTTLDSVEPTPPPTVSNCLAQAVSVVRLRATRRDTVSVEFPFTIRR